MDPRPSPDVLEAYYTGSENYEYWNRVVFPNAQTYDQYLFSAQPLAVPVSPYGGYPSAAAYYARGKWFRILAWCNGGLLVGLSLLTFFGLTLRP